MAAKGTTKLNLNSEKLLNKKFNHAPRGYDALEVDTFFDLIIEDYKKLETRVLVDAQELEIANNKIMELTKENDRLVIEYKKLETRLPKTNKGDINTDNIALLERISALEKYLYKMGIDPTKIK